MAKKPATIEEDHVTGSARSEGYYKIDMREKIKYLLHHRLKNKTTPAELKKKVYGCGLGNIGYGFIYVCCSHRLRVVGV